MNPLEAFAPQQYLNLETFRRSGVGVKTPVWFTQDNGTLFVRTVDNSGKVKRVRQNSAVNIAPCKVDGSLLCAWTPATAREVKDPAINRKVDRLLGQKYGLMKTLFGVASAVQGRKYTILELKVSE
jgi:PPOX class probable F420-dependent enzyme